MKRFLLLVVGTALTATASTQDSRTPVALFYPGLQAYSVQFADVLSVTGNAASLARIKRFSAGIFSERRFMLGELGQHALAAALPTNSGNVGFTADYTGNSLYNQTALGLGYGRSMGERLQVGARFVYSVRSAAGYGSAAAIGFDVAALLRLAEGVQVGMQASNPLRARLGKSDERLPAVYSVGIGFDASSQLQLAAEVQKVENEGAGVNAGLQYVVAENLFARGGIRTATGTFYLGFGFRWKALRLDLTSAFHPSLGATPGLLLTYTRQP